METIQDSKSSEIQNNDGNLANSSSHIQNHTLTVRVPSAASPKKKSQKLKQENYHHRKASRKYDLISNRQDKTLTIHGKQRKINNWNQ